MLKKIFLAILLTLTIPLFSAFAVEDNSSEYVIESYDINLVVNEDNTFDVTENIEVNFKALNKHGIIRQIPLKYKISREDGTTSKAFSKISDIDVDNTFETYNELGFKVIKIGNASETINGRQTYKIKYKYNIGKDKTKNYDELYFDLIGTEWDTTINNVSFKITMPKEFDENKLGFSLGKYGEIEHYDINYYVSGNVITGSYFKTLSPGMGINVRLELPEGYFVGASNNVDILSLSAIYLPIIFIVISFLLRLVYGKDAPVTEITELYPPENYNSAEIGYLYKGKIDDEDVVSLLIYLANKGYIKIEELNTNTDKITKITKLKEYAGDNKNEKIFLDGLFSHGENTTTLSSLENKFYAYLNIIKQNILKENEQKIFVGGNKSVIIYIMIIITALLNFVLLLEMSDFGAIVLSLFIPIIILSLFLAPNKVKLNIIVSIFVFSLLASRMGVDYSSFFNSISLLFSNGVYILGVVCIGIMTMFSKIIRKRSDYGNQILGKIMGFGNFLELAEKDKLEALLTKDSRYFYNILPYTYVLGISDKWVEKFDTIALTQPEWYIGNEMFSIKTFGNSLKSTIRKASISMLSVPSSNSSGSHSGGGFSGGGFSGGGHGGGGGKSW